MCYKEVIVSLFRDKWIMRTGGALRHTVTSWASTLLQDSHFKRSLLWFVLEKNVLYNKLSNVTEDSDFGTAISR